MRKEYLGSDALAEVLAEVADLERQIERERERLTREQVAAVLDGEEEARALDAAARSLVRASLHAAGYRRHKRGEWRRPRKGTTTSGSSPTPRRRR